MMTERAGLNACLLAPPRRRLHRLLAFAIAAMAAATGPAAADVIVNNNDGATGTSQFTQSGTSTLAFGSTVLVIFNDSGSFASTNNQFTGYALSTDGGSTFTDLGRLPTNPLGDAGYAHFARHAASGNVYSTALAFNGGGLQLFRSTDGGLTFGAPVNAAPGVTDANKNAIAIDNGAGAGNGNVYVVTETSVGPLAAVRLFRSIDGGATFGAGILLASGPFALGAPSIAVAPDHRVTVAYREQVDALGTQRLVTRSSTDNGLTFGPPTVAAALARSLSGSLDLFFRASQDPQISVNPLTGQLYLVYADNPASVDRADIFLKTSSDGGATWSAAQRMNTDAGITDQWQPTLAVTPDGKHLGVFWYDRRNDPQNRRIEYFGRQCDIDGGGSLACLADFVASDTSFQPEFSRDAILNPFFMGDYDNAAASDAFFYLSWGDNRLDLLGGAGRKDPNVFFRTVAVVGGSSPPGTVPEPSTSWLLAAALLASCSAAAATARTASTG